MPSQPSSLSSLGYHIIPSFLSPSQLTTLRTAASHLTILARQGKWPAVRTVPKQFPPWPIPSPESPPPIWGVQHLLHPDLPLSEEDKAAFVRLYFEGRLLDVCCALLGESLTSKDGGGDGGGGAVGGEAFNGDVVASNKGRGVNETGEGAENIKVGREDLVMELFNMLVTPGGVEVDDTVDDTFDNANTPGADAGTGPGPGPGTPFALTWHRDSIPWSAPPSQEASILSLPAFHTQWNLALYDDTSLELIPGSHKRVRTASERTTPLDQKMPGATVVALRAGDVAFYDNNIIHRGVYDGHKRRMTLHGSVGHVRGSEARAKNVLQHGVGSYVERCDFSCLDGEEREVAESMRRHLIEMGRGRGDVGYSLEG